MSMKDRVQRLESERQTLISVMAHLAQDSYDVEEIIESFVELISDMENGVAGADRSPVVFLSDTNIN